MKTLRCLVDRVELQLALDGDLPVEAVMARASVLVAARELLREARALSSMSQPVIGSSATPERSGSPCTTVSSSPPRR